MVRRRRNPSLPYPLAPNKPLSLLAPALPSCSREGGSPSPLLSHTHLVGATLVVARPPLSFSREGGNPSSSYLFPLHGGRLRWGCPLLPPLPSWERIKVRAIGVAVGLTGKLCKALQRRKPTHQQPPHPSPFPPPLSSFLPLTSSFLRKQEPTAAGRGAVFPHRRSPPHSEKTHTSPVILRRPRDEESGGDGRSPPLFPLVGDALAPTLAPAKAGAHPLLPPLPSWERIEVRVIGATVGLTGKLRKTLPRRYQPHTLPRLHRDTLPLPKQPSPCYPAYINETSVRHIPIQNPRKMI